MDSYNLASVLISGYIIQVCGADTHAWTVFQFKPMANGVEGR